MVSKAASPKVASRKKTDPKSTAGKISAANTADTRKPGKNAESDAPDITVVRTLGKKELIDRVVDASGIKKKDAKPVIEAMLKELGDALSRGETLNLQPFGKGIVKTRKDLENAEIVELRLRRSKLALKAAEGPASEVSSVFADPLADTAE